MTGTIPAVNEERDEGLGEIVSGDANPGFQSGNRVGLNAPPLVHRVIHMIQKERRVNADANNLVTPAKAGAHG